MEKPIKKNYRPFLPAGRSGSLLFFLLTIFTISCSGLPFREAGPGGVYHRVKSGETLSAIAKAYHVDLQNLAEINNITDPSLIEKDSVIFIPNAPAVIDEIEIISRSKKTAVKIPAVDPAAEKREPPGDAGKKAGADQKKPTQVPGDLFKEETIDPSRESGKAPAASTDSEKAARQVQELKPEKQTAKTERQDQVQEKQQEKQDQVRTNKGIFLWPLRGKVISFFGIQPGGMFFNGIRIAAPGGAAAFAVGDGVVIHSDSLKYYGETVIIQHADDYASVYANLGVRAVTVKARVKKGDRIGFIGNPSGNEEPSLYFEIRHSNKARNPLFFLP
jgi:lipoprotein NlpD